MSNNNIDTNDQSLSGMNDQPGQPENKFSNKIKDPDDWTTGSEPITGAQKSYLETLQGKPVDESITKATASKLIDEARQQQPTAAASAPNNAVKDPKDWVTGNEEMTDAQRSYLKTLADEAGEEVDENLSKASASEKIEELQHKTGRGEENKSE